MNNLASRLGYRVCTVGKAALIGIALLVASVPAGAADIVLDNGDAQFSVTGTWPLSTSVAGYYGSNYQTHAGRPVALIVDNSQGSTSGTWPLSTSVAGYYGSNYQTHTAGTGLNTFTWPLAVGSAAKYRVYARWTAASNRASNAVYTVVHTAGSTPVTVNQQQTNNTWKLLGTYTLDNASRVSLSDAANNYVIADAIKAEPVTELATATWTAPVTTTGEYTVYARWSAASNRASNAVYSIAHAGGSTPVTVNQRQNNNSWQLLGTYTLAPGQGSVTLSNDGANNYVIADAVKFVPSVVAAPKLYYLHTDHLNTPRLVTDEQNKTVWRNDPLAEPFGNTPPEEDPDGDGNAFTMNLRFPGQYADKESNLNYNYFRDYNPQIGRYIQSDPIGLEGGINTYAYVKGQPLRYVDPNGLQALPIPAPPPPAGGAANDPKFGSKLEVIPGSGIYERKGGGGGGGCDCDEFKKALDNTYRALDRYKRTSGILWNNTVVLWQEIQFWASVKEYERDCGPYNPPYPQEPSLESIHDFYGK